MGKSGKRSKTVCLSKNSTKIEDKHEKKCLSDSSEEDEEETLASHSKPKKNVGTVILKVSMHCRACAKKVEKHILKIKAVTSCKVDLETKKVVVMGDINPSEVLESVSKVKRAEIWDSNDDEE